MAIDNITAISTADLLNNRFSSIQPFLRDVFAKTLKSVMAKVKNKALSTYQQISPTQI